MSNPWAQRTNLMYVGVTTRWGLRFGFTSRYDATEFCWEYQTLIEKVEQFETHETLTVFLSKKIPLTQRHVTRYYPSDVLSPNEKANFKKDFCIDKGRLEFHYATTPHSAAAVILINPVFDGDSSSTL